MQIIKKPVSFVEHKIFELPLDDDTQFKYVVLKLSTIEDDDASTQNKIMI